VCVPAHPLDRKILALAIPALGALIAEPLFVLTDTAMVGHLGPRAVAGLGLASTVLTTTVGLLIFLAYATTPIVARRLGAGNRQGALSAGIQGLWLALALGVVLAVVGSLLGKQLIELFGAEESVSTAALIYLDISWWGLPGMLLVIAGTGLLRGLQDTKTPLIIAIVGFAANAALNALLIYGLSLGIAGSALGTVIAQWGMAAVFLVIIGQEAIKTQASPWPGVLGLSQAITSGGWLFLRTLSLRVALIATVVVAAGFGTVELAVWHIAFTVFSLLALALDALAIAGQALVAHGLGSGDKAEVKLVTHRLITWGFLSGGVLALGTGLLAPVIPLVMSSDATLRSALWPVLVLLALSLPLSSYVFILDGILIGAGDGRYLALTGVLNVLMYLPFLWAATGFSTQPGEVNSGGLVMLMLSFGFGYIGARALTLGLRSRGTKWMVLGESR
jgi:putative MATE family efflux protein